MVSLPFEIWEAQLLPCVGSAVLLGRVAQTCSRLGRSVATDLELWRSLARRLLAEYDPRLRLEGVLPPERSPVQVVQLLHGERCQRCRIRPIRRVDWQLLLRCCMACKKPTPAPAARAIPELSDST